MRKMPWFLLIQDARGTTRSSWGEGEREPSLEGVGEGDEVGEEETLFEDL